VSIEFYQDFNRLELRVGGIKNKKAVTLRRIAAFLYIWCEGRISQKPFDINKLLKAICYFMRNYKNLYKLGCVSHIKCILKLTDKIEKNEHETDTIQGPAGTIRLAFSLLLECVC